MTRKMSNERLWECANLLTNLKERRKLFENPTQYTKLDMSVWRCGTAACAVGYCTLDPWFTRRGLTFDIEPHYKGYTHMKAVAEFFGIQLHDAYDLFSTSTTGGNSVRDVARRIRRFVKARM